MSLYLFCSLVFLVYKYCIVCCLCGVGDRISKKGGLCVTGDNPIVGFSVRSCYCQRPRNSSLSFASFFVLASKFSPHRHRCRTSVIGKDGLLLLLAQNLCCSLFPILSLTSLLLPIQELECIPHICHGRHGRRPCKFCLAGVNFFRFNAKNWQFTV